MVFSRSVSKHGPMCLGQCARWHDSSQYRASPHSPHTQSRGSERSYSFPQPQQMRRRMRGQYFRMRGQRFMVLMTSSPPMFALPCLLLKYAVKFLWSSLSSVTASVKAANACMKSGCWETSTTLLSRLGGMAVMAARNSASASATVGLEAAGAASWTASNPETSSSSRFAPFEMPYERVLKLRDCQG